MLKSYPPWFSKEKYEKWLPGTWHWRMVLETWNCCEVQPACCWNSKKQFQLKLSEVARWYLTIPKTWPKTPNCFKGTKSKITPPSLVATKGWNLVTSHPRDVSALSSSRAERSGVDGKFPSMSYEARGCKRGTLVTKWGLCWLCYEMFLFVKYLRYKLQ